MKTLHAGHSAGRKSEWSEGRKNERGDKFAHGEF